LFICLSHSCNLAEDHRFQQREPKALLQLFVHAEAGVYVNKQIAAAAAAAGQQ